MATVCHRPVRAATPSDAARSTTPTRRAVGIGTTPAAIGRLRFVGCARSDSTSSTSFQKYVPLAARQNATNASDARTRLGPSSSTPAAPGAANTSTFFSHCLGRPVRRSPAIIGASSFRRRNASERGGRPHGMVGRTEQLAIAGRVAVRPQHDAATSTFDAVAPRKPLGQPLVEPAQLLGATAVRRRRARRCTSSPSRRRQSRWPARRRRRARARGRRGTARTTPRRARRCGPAGGARTTEPTVSSRSHRSISTPNVGRHPLDGGHRSAAEGGGRGDRPSGGPGRAARAAAITDGARLARPSTSRVAPSRHRNGTTQSRRVSVPSTSNATTTGLSATSDHPARRRCAGPVCAPDRYCCSSRPGGSPISGAVVVAVRCADGRNGFGLAGQTVSTGGSVPSIR